MIYFDNAATTFPKPPGVARAVFRAVEHMGGNPGRGGHALALQSARAVYRVREQAAALFGLDRPENVIFTQNCTHALNLLVYGLLRQGDRVVISDLEHNSVWRPLCDLRRRGVITLEVAETSLESQEQILASFGAAITGGTRLVLCTHTSNVTGTVLPIARIAALAHSRGALMAVDAAQSAGTLDIDMKAMGLDFVCMPGHKGLYGPSGTGMLLIGCEQPLRPLMLGGTGSQSQLETAPAGYPDRLECGTANVCGICGLGEGMAFVRQQTVRQLYAREFSLLQLADARLRNCKGVQLYTPEPRLGTAAPVLSFNVGGLSGEAAAQKLSGMGFALRGGLHCSPPAHRKLGTLERGTVRIGIGAFNSVNEMWRLCKAIEKLQDWV